ncbi:hypothetical protein ABW636_08300 [Aquimarina sp. 2201CG1-2-11]|uniref:hypothetical protein n=1 Tax=Aquimarina discodermiae TaxID=3231043 RepID=UPI0034618D90
MKKILYFICPTDYLEPIINNTFKQENYYYSSLGNSTSFDNNLLEQTKNIIKTKKINEISFVLSNDNRIVLDALEDQCYAEILCLKSLHDQILEQKKHSKISWQTWNDQYLILSAFLNSKIKELKLGLADLLSVDQIKINGSVYNRQKHVFKDIYSDLIIMGYPGFNFHQ